MHTLLKQQPAAQVLPAQQGWPGPPQAWQMPLVVDVLLQIMPATHRSVPLVPEQQASPGLPQDEQIELRQASPGLQLLPQQGWPEAPQPAQ
jgi:hypothetical protein